MNGAQRAAVALLLLALVFLSWLMLTLLDRQAAQGQQQPVKLVSPTSLVRGPQPPTSRSFPRLALAFASAPTGPADHSTTAGGTQTSPAATADPSRPVTTPHPSEVPARSVATRSPAVNAEGEAAATAGPSATLRVRIAWCESRDNPRAVNKTSGASGLYQFLDTTWHNVTGLPGKAADYPPNIQTAAFDRLRAQQGTRPWDASKSCWSKP